MLYLGCIISEQQKDKRTEASEAMQGNDLRYWLSLLDTPQKKSKVHPLSHLGSHRQGTALQNSVSEGRKKRK